MSDTVRATHCSDCAADLTCWDTFMPNFCNACSRALSKCWAMLDNDYEDSRID